MSLDDITVTETMATIWVISPKELKQICKDNNWKMPQDLDELESNHDLVAYLENNVSSYGEIDSEGIEITQE